mmetsp:Transcript_6253/g.9441  ORF Transcript_6253/g.9441 Transcript_6253/m.9441 type:complete len:145 (+) Transcript_6253:81-515(+)
METQKINREKTCPLLLRCFYKHDTNHVATDYKNAAVGILPTQEVQIYTWPDATMREIVDLLKDVVLPGQAKQRNSAFDISLVYPDRNGDHKLRQLAHINLTRQGNDDNKTLCELKFETGDYLDIAIVSGRGTSPRYRGGRGGGY